MASALQFSPSTGRATAVASIAAAVGLQTDPHDGVRSREVIDAALAQGYGWSNAHLQWRAPDDFGAAGVAFCQRQADQAPTGPLFLNGRPDCFPPVPSRGAWQSKTPPASLLKAPFGYLAMVGGSPVVLGGDRAVVPRFSSGFAGLAHLYDHDLARAVGAAPFVEGRALVMLDDVFSANYCMWLLNWLPRMALVPNPDETLRAIVSPIVAPWQTEMLQACGVSPDRIVSVGPWDVVQARHLFVPSHLSEILHPAWKASPWAMKYLRSLFLTPEEASAAPTRRLYVSRRDATGRRVVNEAALAERLAGEGFEEVTLTGMGVAEQARLFASAKAVVAPHGAGLANLVFCRPGARVVEIFARTYGTPAFWLVADGRRLHYATYVVDQVVGASRAQLDDVEVDLDDFEARALPFVTGEDG